MPASVTSRQLHDEVNDWLYHLHYAAVEASTPRGRGGPPDKMFYLVLTM